MDTGFALSAQERLKEMTADDAVKMVRELCAQLGDDAESFHGNIWPGNITFDWEGKAVLGEPSEAAVSERQADQVEYLAPEVFWDNMNSGAADVYSLGLVLYAACNGGYLPFQPKGGALTDKDRSGALRKRMKGERVKLPSGVSPELGAVLNRALAYTPEERYLTAAELLTALGATDEALPGAEAAATAATTADEVEAAAPERELPAEESELAEPAGETSEPASEACETDDAPEGEAEAEEPSDAQMDMPENESAEAPAEVANAPAEPKPEPEEKKYTVQKDFEKRGRRRKTETPASMKKQKKRVSPVIVALCVAAVGVIGGVGAILLKQPAEPVQEEVQEVSEPYVLLPAEPSPEEADVTPSLDDEEATPAPEAEEDKQADAEDAEKAEDAEQVKGSASIDGKDVSPVNDTVYVTGSGVNLRTGPSTTYDVAKTLPRGTELQRTGTVSGWSQVQYEGQEYYISNSLISATNPNGSNAAETAESTAKPTDTSGNAGGTGTSAGSGSGSSSGSGTATAPSDVVYTGTQSAPSRDIVKVVSDANIRSGAGTNYSVLDTAKTGVVLQRIGTTNGWSRVLVGGREGYIYNSLIAPVGADVVTDAVGALKVTSKVNVRSGASTNHSILGVADVGTVLPITGLVDGKWYRVSYNGGDGYVNRKLISVRDFALVRSDEGSIKVTSEANIRSGPGTDYEALGKAAVGDTFTLTGVTDTNWYQVTYDGKTAYIAGNLAEHAG